MRSCSTTSPSPCPTARSCSTGSASPSARGRIRLIGANGCGKSTLLRLIAGELTPARSSVQVAGSLGYLRQDLTLAADLAVEEVLGSARARRALRAIERGRAAAEHCAAVGDDWDVDERARTTLDRLGLAHLGLDRRVGELSGGGSVTQARIADGAVDQGRRGAGQDGGGPPPPASPWGGRAQGRGRSA